VETISEGRGGVERHGGPGTAGRGHSGGVRRAGNAGDAVEKGGVLESRGAVEAGAARWRLAWQADGAVEAPRGAVADSAARWTRLRPQSSEGDWRFGTSGVGKNVEESGPPVRKPTKEAARPSEEASGRLRERQTPYTEHFRYGKAARACCRFGGQHATARIGYG
jgi:hypothetical protein